MENVRSILAWLTSLIAMSMWVLGIAVVKGFWMTVATLFPPVAWVCATQWLLSI